ncbi:MAG: threonine aldolase family protein [Alphaproteobacteria bacterium]
MNLASDNTSGIAPEIMAALARANEGAAMPYGEDEITARLDKAFTGLFETQVKAFPVATGTAANALALALVTPPYGVIYCHEASHVAVDECGAPEFYAGGAKLVPLAGEHGKLKPADVDDVVARGGAGIVHQAQPAAVSLTEATECGTVYTAEEVAALTEVARRHGLSVHMDGARFANAVAALGCAPADVTWRAGVDLLSFGATKNGAMAAEAVVVFDRALAETLDYRRKRAGHLLSKMRYVSAQLEASIGGGLWLKYAAHANRLAARLAEGLAALSGASLCHPVEANEVFVTLPEPVIEGLIAEGHVFYRWEDPGSTTVRLVPSFNTREDDIEAFLAAARRLAERAAATA